MIETPYLLFFGDAPDPLAARVAQGVRDWCPKYAVGQLRLEGCKADVNRPDMSIPEPVGKGAKTLIIGVANRGGTISTAWTSTVLEALEAGLDVASGLHNLLRDDTKLADSAR